MSRHKFPETHGLWSKYKAEYRCWQDLLQRCNNHSHAAYPSYGGRGIFVCNKWACSFEAFMEDMGPRPVGMSLDRINNDGPYAPDNCRWATQKQQNRNHRGNVILEFQGKKQTIIEWSEETGVDHRTILSRHKSGWPIEEIFRQEKNHPVKARVDNKSGLIGASKYHNKWKSQIRSAGKVHYLGLYETAELAHAAYMDVRAKLREKNYG